MKRNLTKLVLLLYSAAAIAGDACFLGFQNISPEAHDARGLTSQTYAELLDTLGQGKLSSPTLEKMRGHENPFDVPEQADFDLSGLRTQMKKFEAMVREKGWYTDAIVERLRMDLGARIAGIRQAERAGEEALKNQWPDYDIPLPLDSGGDLSHDGRYLVGSSRQRGSDAGTPWKLAVHDVEKNQTKEYDAPPFDMSDPTFSRYGGKLLFKAHGQRLVVVPFVNGRPHFGQAYTVGDTEFGGGRSSFILEGLGSRYAIAGEWLPDLFLFDFMAKTRVPLKIEQLFSPEEKRTLQDHFVQDAFGMVPGTGDFYLRRVQKPNRERLRTYTVMTDGTLVPKTTLWSQALPDLAKQPDRAERGFFFLPDRRPVTVQGDPASANFVFRVGAGAEEFPFEVPAALGPVAPPGQQFKIKVNPTRPEVMVPVVSQDRKKQWMVFYDFAAKKVIGRVEVPMGSYPKYSPDGGRVYVQLHQPQVHQRAINYRGRLEN